MTRKKVVFEYERYIWDVNNALICLCILACILACIFIRINYQLSKTKKISGG